jgi:hypothetical protein
MVVQAIDEKEYHAPIEINQSLVCVVLFSDVE